MGKKLLSVFFLVSIFFLNSWSGFGQCPTSVSISANPGTTICAGTEVIFTASPTGGDNLQYQWQVNGANVTGTGSTFKTTTLTNGQKVRVLVTSTTSGIETCSTTSNELTMTVNAVQTPTVSISTSKTAICPGESITFNATNTYGGTNPQYAWYINNSTSASKTGASVTFAASDFTPGANTVKVILTSNFNCTTSSTAEATSSQFTVREDATISDPPNDVQAVCINNAIASIQYSIGGGGTGATVTGLPTGVSGSFNAGTFTISGIPTVAGEFNYTVSTTGNCAQKTGSGKITVNPDATIALASGSTNQTVCAAGGVSTGAIDPIKYSIGATGTGATVTGLPDGIAGSFSNGIFTIAGSSSVTGTHNYTVKATGTCGESAPLTGSLTITENVTPAVSITSNDADNVICAGTSVTFTATPTNGGTSPIYQWKVNGTNAGTNSSTFTTTALTDGQTVSVVMTSNATCLTTATATSSSITTAVNPNLTPEVTIEASDSDICPNDSVTFTATPIHGGANPVYQWKIGNSNVGTNSPTFTTSALTDGQVVTVVMTSNETCLATTTATSNAIETNVNPDLIPSVTISSNDSNNTICSGSSITFTATPVNGGGTPSYQWKVGSSNVGTNSPTFTTSSLTNGQVVTVVMTASNDICLGDVTSATSNAIPVQVDNSISNSIPEFDNSNLSPNPTAICPSVSGLIYRVAPITGATSYDWTLPSGWSITNGAGTNEITVSANVNASAGNVSVQGRSECGQSQAASVSVTTGTAAHVGAGPDQTVCPGTTLITLAGEIGGVITQAKDWDWLASVNGGSFTSTGFSNGGNSLNGTYSIPTSVQNGGTVTIRIQSVKPAGNCDIKTDEMTITIQSAASISDPATKNQTVCINSAIEPISFTIGGAGQGATTTGLPPGISGIYENGIFTLSGTPTVAGTYNYTVTTTGNCSNASRNGTIKVDPLNTVTAGQAATDIVCQAATPSPITLTGATFGGGATSASWSITSGGGTLSNIAQTTNPQNITYTPAANFTGDVVLTLTTNAPGKCAEVSATRTITVQPAPIVEAGEATTDIVCQSDSPAAITLTGASFGGGATSAAWTITSGGGSLSSTELTTNPSAVTYTPAAGYTGEVVLTLISDAPGVCAAVNDTRTITVEPAATVEAGEAATDVVCQSGSPAPITLTGASFGGGATTAAWAITSGGGILSSTDQTATPQNITYTPAANYTGEVVLTLTTNAPGTCAAVNDTRTITVEPAAIVEAGGIEEGEEGGCQSATPGPITLTGATLSGGAVTAAWSITEGEGNLSSTAQTSQPELVTYTPAPNFTGTVKLTLTSAPAGNCAAVSDTRIILISEALTVDAGPDIELCSGSTVTLSDVVLGAGVETGRWEIISGQGELSSTIATTTPETVTFTAPNQFKGETVLRLTSNNPEGLCDEIYDEKIINIQQEVTVTTPPVNLGICSTQDATFEVVASGDNLSYQWFFGETPIANATSAKLVIRQATSANAGTYTVHITGKSSCGEAIVSEPVTLNVDEDIVINTQPVGGNYCVGSTVNLAVEASAGGAELSYEWFNANNESVGTGASLIIENVQTSFSGNYYAIITGPAGFTCSTVTTEIVTVVVNPAPVIQSTGAPIEVCSVGEEVNITSGVKVSNESSILWSVPVGMGTIANSTSLTAATYVPNGATGTVVLSLTVQGLDGCSEITATKNITIIPQPELTGFSYSGNITDIATEFCETDEGVKSPLIEGENLTAGEGVYSLTSGTGLTVDPVTGNFTPNGSAPGEYVITYTFTATSNGACEPVTRDFKVVIGQNPVATFSFDSSIYCKDTRDATLNVNPVISLTETRGENFDSFNVVDGAGTVIPNSGLALNAETGAIDLSNSTAGEYIVQRTLDYTGAEEDGCIAVTAVSTITITDKPIADFTYPAAEYCSDSAAPVSIEPIMDAGAVKGNWTYTATPEGAALVLDPTTGGIDVTTSDAGTFVITNIVDTAEDGCDAVNGSSTITINKRSDATFAYGSNSYCISSGLASVTEGYETGGTFSSTTLGSRLNPTTGAVTWSATDAITGTHSITYTIPGKGVCEDVTSSVVINIDPLPVGGDLLFANVGRLFTICQNAVGDYAEPLILTGSNGEVISWKYRSFDSTSWSTLVIGGEPFTGTSLSADQIESFNFQKTTVFQVEVRSGVCSPDALSQTAILSVIPSDITPTPVTVDPGVVCLGEEVTLNSETGYETGGTLLDQGAFDNASITNHGWRIRRGNSNTDLGFDTDANNVVPDRWKRATPRAFGTASISPPYSTSGVVFDTGIEDGNKGFAIVSGQNTSTMETPIFTIGSMDQAILTFDQAYVLTPGASLKVEISTDGGNTYTTVYVREVPADASKGIESGNTTKFGTGTVETTPENKVIVDLGKYIGRQNLRIRFNYVGARPGDIWAVDNIDIPEGPGGVTMEWRDYTNPEVPEGVFIGTNNSEKYIPTKIGLNVFEVKTKLVYNSKGDACEVAENAQRIEVFVFDKYTTTTTAVAGSCGNLTAPLSATVTNATGTIFTSFPTPDGYVGEWKIESTTGYSLLDSNPDDGIAAINDPNAILSANEIGTFKASFVLKPTLKNAAGVLYENKNCLPTAATQDVVFQPCTTLDFDGVDDFVDLGEGYTGDYSIEAWIRPEAATGTIISTPQLEINMADLPEVTPNTRWYHIAVDSDGLLYIDGIASGTTISKTGSTRAFIGARWNSPNTENHFSGWIEEVRIWNGKISEKNIRFTMNQRLKADGNIGVVVDMAHPDAPVFVNLAGYYQLIATNILNGGYTLDLAANAVNGKLRNMTTTQENTAPLPYYTANDGSWDTPTTWAQPDVWKLPSTDQIEWNIVRSFHNVNSNRDISVLGLLSEENVLTMEGTYPSNWNSTGSGNALNISHYLLLNGIIDLVGESQLVQPNGSIVDAGSTGYLERDQQGTASSYNYNYWSSPVSPGTGNADYTVAGVMRDGTNPATPHDLAFGAPYTHADGGFSTPRKVSDYWINKFRGDANVYSEWVRIGSAGNLNVGEGYTMKGTSGNAAISDSQNYIFVGKPNNGTIALEVGQQQNYLLGNPYPSAISVEEFLMDNLKNVGTATGRNDQNVFNGAIYFWDHFSGKTHILKEYVGGYATLNLLAGVPAVSNDERINHESNENGNKIPGPYISVGQGFFINTAIDEDLSGLTPAGGNVLFKNNQREFVPDANGNSGPAVFLRPEINTKTSKAPKADTRAKIRLLYKSPLGYHRQILVGVDPNASNGFDLGYDAPLNENNVEDMYWVQENNWLVIQGVSHFDEDQELPLGVKLKDKGEFTIEIHKLENFPDNKNVYIKDKLNDTIHDIRKQPYKATAEGGYSNDRFEIVFFKEEAVADQPPVVEEPSPEIPGEEVPGSGKWDEFKDLTVRHSHTRREIQILNPDQVPLSNMYIFDINGNQIEHYRNLSHEKVVVLPVRNFATGAYIIKLYSEGRVINRKIIISN